MESKELEMQEDTKTPIIGEFTPKRKFLNFMSAVSGARVRFNRDTAFIKGGKLSGMLEGVVFKITLCDEGTINFEEVETNKSDSAMRKRLLDDIDSMDVTGYAQKYIVSGLDFYDLDDNRCYLEVEYKKPIEQLRSIFDEETPELSENSLNILDSLFGEEEEEDTPTISETNDELVEESIRNIEESIEVSKNYMEESIRKMNEEKVNELKKRIEDTERDIVKFRNDIKKTESLLDEHNKNLVLLNKRLETLTPSEEPNGYVFFVSEEQKNDVTLDETTVEVIGKISDIMGLKKDALVEHLTTGFYKIKITSSSDITDTNPIEKDLLNTLSSLDVNGDLKMVSNNEFEYRGKMDWHQLVNRMLRLGFEQNPEFDKLSGSNSYKENEEEVIDNQDAVDNETSNDKDNQSMLDKIKKIFS